MDRKRFGRWVLERYETKKEKLKGPLAVGDTKGSTYLSRRIGRPSVAISIGIGIPVHVS